MIQLLGLQDDDQAEVHLRRLIKGYPNSRLAQHARTMLGEEPIELLSYARPKRLPQQHALGQNYPNPFNPTTTIQYELPKAGHVRLMIYNLLGQEVRTLVDTFQSAGYHRVVWGGRDDRGQLVGSAVYLYQLTAGEFSESKKMILLK